jgi:hypothetical protein
VIVPCRYFLNRAEVSGYIALAVVVVSPASNEAIGVHRLLGRNNPGRKKRSNKPGSGERDSGSSRDVLHGVSVLV